MWIPTISTFLIFRAAALGGSLTGHVQAKLPGLVFRVDAHAQEILAGRRTQRGKTIQACRLHRCTGMGRWIYRPLPPGPGFFHDFESSGVLIVDAARTTRAPAKSQLPRASIMTTVWRGKTSC